MKVIIAKDYGEMSRKAAKIVTDLVKSEPYAVLGLATGSTPLGLYRNMKEDHARNGTSYAHIRTVNLDEYIGLSKEHPQSYARFMKKNLFDGLDLDPENAHIENGMQADERAECERYDRLLESLPRDLQILGLGRNGHIAFNEPGTPFGSNTHVAELAPETVKDNARLFSDPFEVPKRAYTMGIRQIMSAKQILLLASGAAKADALFRAVCGEVTERVPASVLQLHPNCIAIADKAAAELLIAGHAERMQ